MLKVRKETLSELTPEQMASVVGAAADALWRSCVVASCITGDIDQAGTIFIRTTEGC